MNRPEIFENFYGQNFTFIDHQSTIEVNSKRKEMLKDVLVSLMQAVLQVEQWHLDGLVKVAINQTNFPIKNNCIQVYIYKLQK